jgi:hypothetical protein
LAACSLFGPGERALALPGVAVKVPASMVDLEPDKVERLRQSALAQAPDQTVDLVALRDPAGMSAGAVYVQRSVDPDATRYGATVGEALRALEDQLRDAMGASADLQGADRDGGREICGTVDVARDDQHVPVRTCVLATVDPQRRVLLLAVTCLGGAATLCDGVFATRTYDPGEVLPLDTAFPPPPPPAGLPGVAGATAWGVPFGGSRAAFQAACARAGHQVDAFDWAVEAPQVRAWFDQGRVSQCTGLPAPTSAELGPLVTTSALFDHDQMFALTLFLDTAPDALEARIAAAYPASAQGVGQVMHVIDEDAVDDQVISVTVAPSAVKGARSSLTFLSARGAYAPIEP